MARQLEDAIGRERPHRQVVVAGPAEPAQVGAAADHFDQEARAELGVGREQRRVRWIEPLGALDRGLAHDRRRAAAGQRIHRHEAPGVVVARRVERRDVEARLAGQPAQHVAARPAAADGLDQVGDERLAFARRDQIGEEGQRLGVDEGHGAADYDQRVFLRSLLGVDRQPGPPQQRDDVGVVPLERDRERHHVEVGDGRLRFERDEPGATRLELGQGRLRRQEEPLADDVVEIVEQPVDGLEAEVRHPDVVAVRERQGHPEPAGVRLDDVADLARQGGAGELTLCVRLRGGQAFQGNTRVRARPDGLRPEPAAQRLTSRSWGDRWSPRPLRWPWACR